MEIYPGIHARAPVDADGERLREKRRELQRQWEQWHWHKAQARRHRTVMGVLIGHHEQEANRLAKELGIESEADAGTEEA
jgi:hypothetical protein